MRFTCAVLSAILLPGAAFGADTRLAEAAMHEDSAAVRSLIQQKAGVNAKLVTVTGITHYQTNRFRNALRQAVPWMYSISSDAIRWFLFALSAFIIAWAGRRFYLKAWSALLHKTTDMNTLVALGTGTAFLYSAGTTVAPGFFISHGIAPDTYFEAGILIMGLVLTGNTLESRAKGQTAVALRKLVQMQPKTARVLRDGAGERMRRFLSLAGIAG